MPFIRMSEESIYVHKVGELLNSLASASRDELVHRDFCVYWFPQDQLWFIESHEFWWRDLQFERHARVGTRKHFVGWKNVKMFGVPICVCDEVYVPVPEVWRKL